ncbi:MAG: class I SAM-dependent methyltransferase [Proteobacteria bacterium]|nr:class I SAM-dependent methyltransferase [Pseudomonadota bacterium]
MWVAPAPAVGRPGAEAGDGCRRGVADAPGSDPKTAGAVDRACGQLAARGLHAVCRRLRDAMLNSDSEWECWAQREPYFGVLTHPKFRRELLSCSAIEEFFETGESTIDALGQTIRHHLEPDFSPGRVLDFGCGVGRLVVPLAKRYPQVVGADVSPAMLEEARKNCAERQLGNVTLVRSSDCLSNVDGPFDYINSSIVFQHIPVRRGERIFKGLLDRLRPGGVASLHVTYGKLDRKGRRVLRLRPGRWFQRARHTGYAAVERISGRRFRDPEMQMNFYDMNRLMHILQAAGVTSCYVEHTNHGGFLGAVLFLRKPESGV